MLQQTCRNIGSDLPFKPKDQTPKSRQGLVKATRTSPHAMPRPVKERYKRMPSQLDKLEKVGFAHPNCGTVPSTMHPSPPAAQLPSCSPASDYNQFAATQYQLMCQKLAYQKELQKLHMSTPNLSNYLPYTPSYGDAASLSPPLSNSLNQTDFAKLAAFFYNKLEQTTSKNINPLSATTEAFQNYQRIILENNNASLLAPLSHELKQPSPTPQLHECHWVTPTGICGKKHCSYEDLMLHLASHASGSADTLAASKLSPSIPNLLSHLDYPYKSTLDIGPTKSFAKSLNHLSYHPYSLPSRQLPAPFLH